MSLSGRVWPAPPLIHCICLRVIPHPHLFNFTRQSFLCVFRLLSHKILITHGLCFGREEIDGCDQCLERESWGNAGTQNYCSTFIIFSFMFALLFLAWRGYSLEQTVFPKVLKNWICLHEESRPSTEWFMTNGCSCSFFMLQWSTARCISENNGCIEPIKHPCLALKTRPGFLCFQSYISLLFPTNLYETTSSRFSFISLISFISAVLVRLCLDISVIKAKWRIPRLAPQLQPFNAIQSKCPVQLLAVTATRHLKEKAFQKKH